MSQNPLPSAALNANASNSVNWSWSKAIVTIAALLLGVVVVLVGGSLLVRYELFDTVRGDVYGFFRETVGVDRPTALTLGFGLGLIVVGVLWKSLWSLLLGRITGTLLVAAGIGLLGYWGFSKYGTAPMTPTGKPNQNYVVVDGKCEFFDRDTRIDPRSGKKLFPVTEKVLEACANRKNGKSPKEVAVANPAKVEWFDRVLGHPAVYYVKRFNGHMAFFDAPGTDPITGQPLEPVTVEVVKAAMAEGIGASPIAGKPASVDPSPTIQSSGNAASSDANHQRRVVLSAAPEAMSRLSAPTRDAVLLVGEANNHAQILIDRLQREGVVRHAQKLPGSVAWPAIGSPDAAALEAARMVGIRSVAVVSLHKDVKTTAELAGFAHATLTVKTRVFDTQTGRMTASTQSHGEGRAFDSSGAIAQAVAQLGS